nr:MAG TPA: hypothetical protein [Caudoviricetes sp.]
MRSDCRDAVAFFLASVRPPVIGAAGHSVKPAAL